MPNYDYICDQCQHIQEIFQKMKDTPLTECPQCQHQTFRRKIGGGAGLHFTGSGFYITDYGQHKHTSCCPCNKNTDCSS